jgi:hypothetical protein
MLIASPPELTKTTAAGEQTKGRKLKALLAVGPYAQVIRQNSPSASGRRAVIKCSEKQL